jgi:hypothetical protein
VSTEYRDRPYPRVLSATKRAGPLKRARVNVVRDATKLLLDDGWLALTLFAALLLLLVLQR